MNPLQLKAPTVSSPWIFEPTPIPTTETEISDDESFSEMVVAINYIAVAEVKDKSGESSPRGSPTPGPSQRFIRTSGRERTLSRAPSQAEEAQEDPVYPQGSFGVAAYIPKEESVTFTTSSGIRYHSKKPSFWEFFKNLF